jgi:hypothetical protein
VKRCSFCWTAAASTVLAVSHPLLALNFASARTVWGRYGAVHGRRDRHVQAWLRLGPPPALSCMITCPPTCDLNIRIANPLCSVTFVIIVISLLCTITAHMSFAVAGVQLVGKAHCVGSAAHSTVTWVELSRQHRQLHGAWHCG